MTQEHRDNKVFIGPGMDGIRWGIRFVTRNWQEKYDLNVKVLETTWKDDESFDVKFDYALKEIDGAIESGDDVYVVGCSAWGQMAMNIFAERRDEIKGAVNVGGFLRPGNRTGIRNFDRRSRQSIAFKQGVYRFVDIEPTLTEGDRKKILTIRPRFGDELVPPETVLVRGAINKTVPMGEHIAGIATALSLYDPLIIFLKDE